MEKNIKTKEDFLKSSTSTTNWNFLEHVYHSGEVYKQILTAMQEYADQEVEKIIEIYKFNKTNTN